ncbi:HIT family protein [Kiloniella sp. b19]|uniref:HIT family protein n=1 Tax=Kiloniella sp. GXU_MW_B19 TaxID=3141326 RepID=UPI0031D05CDC
MAFSLHPQLAADTVPVEETEEHLILLMNDSQYPWLILVPKQEGLRDLDDLESDAYDRTLHRVRALSKTLKAEFSAEKINVAALGNMVPQLHIHIIARFQDDPAWPAPVWGAKPARPYEKDALQAMKARMLKSL